MKQSVIKYTKMIDDQIKIVGFDHVASMGKIGKEFGRSVGEAYIHSFPFYNKESTNSIFIKTGEEEEDHILLTVDQVIPKESFQEAISIMKQAGRRLIDIQEEVDDTVREIKI